MNADSKTEAEVMTALNNFLEAYKNRNWDEVQTYLAPDPDLVVIGIEKDEKRIGLVEVRAMIERDWARTEAAISKVDWAQVSAAGSVAWVVADITYTVKTGRQEKNFPGLRSTTVLEKRADKWLIVQSHFSEPSDYQEEG